MEMNVSAAVELVEKLSTIGFDYFVRESSLANLMTGLSKHGCKILS